MQRVLLVTLMVGLSAAVVFTQGGTHSAHWYNQDAANGRFSVLLNQPNGLESVVAVTREKGIETTILGIGSDMSYQRKILNCAPGAACFPPNIILGIDQNLNGRYDADDFQWQWSLVDETPLVADPRYLHGDTFLQCEAQVPVGTPDATWVTVDAYATYACYHPSTTGTGYDLDYFTLSDYQLGLGAPDILPTSHVRALKVLAGGAGSWLTYDALVDVVTLGGAIRIDEPNNSRAHFEVDTQ